MLSNGTLLTVSSTSHPDLLFALRGGGPFYAIVLEWTFRITPVPPVVTVAYRRWNKVDIGTAVRVISAYNAMEPWQLPSAVSMVELFHG